MPATKPDIAGTCSPSACRWIALTFTRPQVMDAMRVRQVATSVSYESPHLTSLFRKQGWKAGDLPNTELIADTTLTLPLHAGLTER